MVKSISIMSKIVCFILVVVVLLDSSSIVYADTNVYQIDAVYGQTVGTPKSVYTVDVTWGKMQFICKTVGTRKWNQKSHLFDESFVSTWSASGNTVKVTNHSNEDIKATFKYKNREQYTGIIGTFTGDSEMTLPSAVGKEVDDTELTATKQLNLSGSIDYMLDNYTPVGNINIEIN